MILLGGKELMFNLKKLHIHIYLETQISRKKEIRTEITTTKRIEKINKVKTELFKRKIKFMNP